MTPVTPSQTSLTILKAARRLGNAVDASAVVVLAEHKYDFEEIAKLFRKGRMIVTSDQPEILEAAKAANLPVVEMLHEPQTRQIQLSQALLEAVADELLQSGDRIIAVYPGFDRNRFDSISIINLTEHLAKLTSRDLQRLETQVPLGTLRRVVDLAVEIGREGREGKAVGALFVVGNHRKVMSMSHEHVHDPFRGYPMKECSLRSPRVRESIKELAQIDGAFIISAEGEARAAGRILDAPQEGLTLSKGLGARHWAAAAISKVSDAIAIAVSESTGTVRIFQNGNVMLRIEPLDRAMTWHDVETEPPGASGD